MLSPPPSFEDRGDSGSPTRQRQNSTGGRNSAGNSPSSASKYPRMRVSYANGLTYTGGNLMLSATAQHPLKSRENSPEHQFQRQCEQPIRTLSPVHLAHTPQLGYNSCSPPSSTAPTSPEDLHTPPTTAVSTPPRSAWGSHHHLPLLSERQAFAPSPAPSHLSFEVLSGYGSITPAEKIHHHQRSIYATQTQHMGVERPYMWEREASPPYEDSIHPPEFTPNADIPFPISEGLRRFYPRAPIHDIEERERLRELERERDSRSPVAPIAPTEFFERFNTFATSAKQRFGGSRGYRAEMLMEEEDDEAASRVYSVPRESELPMSSGTNMDDSMMSRATSGIPSYTREFGTGWRDPIRAESAMSNASSLHKISILTQQPNQPPTQATGRKEDTLFSAYAHELTHQIDTILRRIKRPFCFVLLLGGIGLLISLAVTSFAVPLLCRNPGFMAMSQCQNYYRGQHFLSPQEQNSTYPDFPTLMSIESSFEKIVDGAAGGSALARAMKSSEMAVSDLSTVVKYSDLKCRESLSSKLDAFATDAKSNVRALSAWGSKVGGVLDQLLSVNHYSLRELNGLKEYENRKSFIGIVLAPFEPILTPILYKPAMYVLSTLTPYQNLPPPTGRLVHHHSPQTRAQIAATFNKAAEVLELNLRQLVTDGETIFRSLTHLSEQHKPIYDEIVREVVDIKKGEEVVLSSLWTKMGGNQIQRKNFRDNAKLLEMIGKYEEEARGYVESTVLELDRMMADLEILRRRVAEPLLVGEGNMPAIHMGSGVGDIPLQVHIEAIEKAVERLVRKRGERREREDSYLRALIEQNERGPRVDIIVED
ncbi:hypothetical protein DFH27DRAFT_396765 [Peziza echinospora]|nr:hypothetical protein DFH27DRAFT_396765 [Peziza echinospora]